MYYHHFQCIDVLKPYFSAHQFLTLQNSRTHVTTVRRKTLLNKYLERRADVFSSFYSFICENGKGICYFWKFSESILAFGGTVQQNHVIVTCWPIGESFLILKQMISHGKALCSTSWQKMLFQPRSRNESSWETLYQTLHEIVANN